MANYPTSSPSFPTRAAGQTITSALVNSIQDEVVAIGAGLLTGTAKIQFPAIQSPSADANALDDYEEGGFTPVINGSGGQSGQAYSLQTGSYTKIGQQVHLAGRVTLSALGTVTGTVRIGGLSFVSAATYGWGPVVIGYFGSLSTAVVWIGGFVGPGANYIDLYHLTAAGTLPVVMVQADMSNLTDLIFNVTYRV